MGTNKFKVIFVIDLIFIAFIPALSNIYPSGQGSALDYLIPYFSGFISLFTIGIFVGVLCIKKILK
ncbi:hypothetical protein CE561_00145 [Thermoanaerobacterium thermosaccharolyticum]|uniref:Uncharacterized protein n=1 Tax=Thermoanaerobacterium thermosaccharolyticum TaxID=1517 RepID=A0A231VMT0_THETR|nr:hypothetical protein CE561_00145 [Thermoanaerobacterium thermosaccharolyticum]